MENIKTLDTLILYHPFYYQNNMKIRYFIPVIISLDLFNFNEIKRGRGIANTEQTI